MYDIFGCASDFAHNFRHLMPTTLNCGATHFGIRTVKNNQKANTNPVATEENLRIHLISLKLAAVIQSANGHFGMRAVKKNRKALSGGAGRPVGIYGHI